MKKTLKEKWNYFRYITLQHIIWYASGMFIWDLVYSYYWLNIAKRRELWRDADSRQCPRKYCRFCGKGGKLMKNIIDWAKDMGYDILDPDGFDRTDPECMTKLRTKEEFDKGFTNCTIAKIKN